MTRHERLTLGVSLAALVISIASPFLNYYWFQSEVRIRQLKTDAFRVEGNVYLCPDTETIAFDIRLKNRGAWPIDHVRLLIQKTLQTVDIYMASDFVRFSFDKRAIKPWPPLNASIEENRDDILVNFKEAIPPNSDVDLGALPIEHIQVEYMFLVPDLESLQPRVWVLSEVSTFHLDWNFKGIDCSTVARLRRVWSRP